MCTGHIRILSTAVLFYLKSYPAHLMLLLIGSCLLLSADHVEAQNVSIPNFHKVYDDVYRGARPREQGIKELKRMGIKAIVNLEREICEKEQGEVKKERKWAEEAGITFFHVPLHPFFAPKREELERALAYITLSHAGTRLEFREDL